MKSNIESNIQRVRRYFAGKTVVIPNEESGVKLRSYDPMVVSYDAGWKPSKYGYQSSYHSYGSVNKYNRLHLFYEYDLMERDPIISRALTLISEDTCLPDEYDNIIQINTDKEEIKISLEHLFYQVLKIDFSLSTWVRMMLKYGDCFIYLNIKDKIGVTDGLALNPVDVERIEDDEDDEYMLYFKANNIVKGKIPEERMAHFRHGKDSNMYPYGTSYLEPVRRHWKQLSLLEDFMMVYYMLRSVNQRVFKVDVGNLSPKDVPSYINTFRSMLYKQPLVDEQTGEYDLHYDPLNILEDVVLPIRPGYDNTQFDEIPASTETNIVEGIDYFRQKMMAGLGIPNFLLNYEEQINSRATASSEDIRLAKLVESVQKIVISELEKIAVIHLLLQGYTKKDIYSFSIGLTPPSNLHEMEKLELFGSRLNEAQNAKQSELFSDEWIYKNIFNLTDDEIEDIRDQIYQENRKRVVDESVIEKLGDIEVSEQEEPEPDIEPTTVDTDDDDSPDDTDTEEDDTSKETDSGEGSQGGLTEPPQGPDEIQRTTPSVRAQDAIEAKGTTDVPERRGSSPEDRTDVD